MRASGLLQGIERDLQALERDETLRNEGNFRGRAEALERIEADILPRLDALRVGTGQAAALRARAEAAQASLEEANRRLFGQLRGRIRSGGLSGADLKRALLECAGPATHEDGTAGYDALDALVSGLVLGEPVPEETKQLEPEMVAYQPAPARIILEMVERAGFSEGDVFYDIGSGLGQVVLLAHLLGGVRSRGIEFEPVYCAYARRRAEALNLTGADFIHADAREADFSDGTVFFLYTPFRGKILAAVLARLEDAAHAKEVRVFTYGPCTADVARQPWLRHLDRNRNHPYKLAVFRSRRD